MIGCRSRTTNSALEGDSLFRYKSLIKASSRFSVCSRACYTSPERDNIYYALNLYGLMFDAFNPYCR